MQKPNTPPRRTRTYTVRCLPGIVITMENAWTDAEFRRFCRLAEAGIQQTAAYRRRTRRAQ